MPGIAIGMGDRCQGSQTPPTNPIRVVPAGDYEAFAIAAHPELGAIALHLIDGNGADVSTPAASLGQTFGGWRIAGFRILASTESDPEGAAEIVYEGVGAQEIAINLANVWGGHYHGFGPGVAHSQNAPDLTQEAMLAAFEIESSGEIVWSGATGTWEQALTLEADGTIATSAAVSLQADVLTAYLDMTIVDAGFSRASLDGGQSWEDLTQMAINDTLDANVASVVFRNPSSGTTVTVTDDALGVAGFASKRIQRRASDYKLYPAINPLPAGTHLGTVAINRTIAFGATSADPLSAEILHWVGSEDGPVHINSNGSPQVGFADGKLTLTRSAGTGIPMRARPAFLMTGLVADQTYQVPVIMEVEGSSLAGGTTLAVSLDSNGASGVGLGNAAAGSQLYTFTAIAEQMYLYFDQPWLAASDNVLKILEIGPVSETP